MVGRFLGDLTVQAAGYFALGAVGSFGVGGESMLAESAGSELQAFRGASFSSETRFAAIESGTFSASSGAGESVTLDYNFGAAGPSSANSSVLPYRQGINYSFDTFNQALGSAPTAELREMPAQLPSLQGNIPNAAKWISNGGSVQYTPNGGMTYMLKSGAAVTYNPSGFPDFSPYLYRGNDGLSQVRIDLTGSRTGDEAAANAAAGFEETPLGYTWHHNEDLGLMQLIEEDVHAAFPHTGGFSINQR